MKESRSGRWSTWRLRPQPLPAADGRREQPDDGGQVHGADGDRHQPPPGRGVGGQVERDPAQVGVRVRVHDDASRRRRRWSVAPGAVAEVQGEVGPAQVEVAGEGGEGGVDEGGLAQLVLERRPPLDLGHHRGVEAEAGVEEEPAAVDHAQGHAPDGAGGQRACRAGPPPCPAFVGHADGAGEDVGRPAGQGGHGGVGADQAVGRLVEGAVAPEDHHDVGPGGGGLGGQGGGVVAAGGAPAPRARGTRPGWPRPAACFFGVTVEA